MPARTPLLAAIPVAALLLTGCSSPPNCNTLLGEPPSRALQAAADEVVNGEAVEVEVEVTDPQTDADVECVVQGDRWVNVTDDTA